MIVFKRISNDSSYQHDVKEDRTLFAFVEEEFVLVCAQESHSAPCNNCLGSFEVKHFNLRWIHGDKGSRGLRNLF